MVLHMQTGRGQQLALDADLQPTREHNHIELDTCEIWLLADLYMLSFCLALTSTLTLCSEHPCLPLLLRTMLCPSQGLGVI